MNEFIGFCCIIKFHRYLDKGQKLSDTVKEKGVVKQIYFLHLWSVALRKSEPCFYFWFFTIFIIRCFIVAYWMRGKDWVSYFLKSLRYLCFTEKWQGILLWQGRKYLPFFRMMQYNVNNKFFRLESMMG